MSILDGTATAVPAWVRVILGGFAVAFAVLGWRLLGMARSGAWQAWIAVALAVIVAAVLGVIAIRGRMWRGLWLAQILTPPWPSARLERARDLPRLGVVLPYGRVVGNIATMSWQDSDPSDERRWIAPRLPACLTSDDCFAGRAPALDAIRRVIGESR